MKKISLALVLISMLAACTDLSYDLMRIDPQIEILPGLKAGIDTTIVFDAASIENIFDDEASSVTATIPLSAIGLDLSAWKGEYTNVKTLEAGYSVKNSIPVMVTAASAKPDSFDFEMKDIGSGTENNAYVYDGVMKITTSKNLLIYDDLPIAVTLTREGTFGGYGAAGELTLTLKWISFPEGLGVNFLQ